MVISRPPTQTIAEKVWRGLPFFSPRVGHKGERQTFKTCNCVEVVFPSWLWILPQPNQYLPSYLYAFISSSCSSNKYCTQICPQNKRHSHSYPAFILSVRLSLSLIRLGIHAGLPWVPGHLGHGEEQEGDASEKEEDEGGAGTSEGPGVVVLDPDRVLALDHALDRLPHHFQWDEGAETCDGEERRVNTTKRCDREGKAGFLPFQNVWLVEWTHLQMQKTCRQVWGGSLFLCLYRYRIPPSTETPGLWRRGWRWRWLRLRCCTLEKKWESGFCLFVEFVDVNKFNFTRLLKAIMFPSKYKYAIRLKSVDR